MQKAQAGSLIEFKVKMLEIQLWLLVFDSRVLYSLGGRNKIEWNDRSAKPILSPYLKWTKVENAAFVMPISQWNIQ